MLKYKYMYCRDSVNENFVVKESIIYNGSYIYHISYNARGQIQSYISE